MPASVVTTQLFARRLVLHVGASGVAATLRLSDELSLPELVSLGYRSKRMTDTELLRLCHENLHGSACELEGCRAVPKLSRDLLRPFSLIRKRKTDFMRASSVQQDAIFRFDFFGEHVTVGPLSCQFGVDFIAQCVAHLHKAGNGRIFIHGMRIEFA